MSMAVTFVLFYYHQIATITLRQNLMHFIGTVIDKAGNFQTCVHEIWLDYFKNLAIRNL